MSTQYEYVITTLQQELGKIAPDDGMALRAILGTARRQVDAAMRTSLKRGAFVTFYASKLSVSLIGKVVKVNPKSASVAIVEPVSHAGQIWRVSPSLLSTCAAPIFRPSMRLGPRKLREHSAAKSGSVPTNVMRGT